MKYFFEYVNQRYEKLINILISQIFNDSLLVNTLFIYIICIALLNMHKKYKNYYSGLRKRLGK